MEGETKLKQQQNLYEAVRSDRNLYSKNLIESQDEIAEMKRKFKIMNHQIEQLKEEIHSKDQNLVREHLDRMKVEKEKDVLRDNLQKLRKREHERESEKKEKKLRHRVRTNSTRDSCRIFIPRRSRRAATHQPFDHLWTSRTNASSVTLRIFFRFDFC